MIATSKSRTNIAKACVVRSNNASCHRPDVIDWRGGVGSRRSNGRRSAGVNMGAVAIIVMIYPWTYNRPRRVPWGRLDKSTQNRSRSIPDLLAGSVLDLALPRLGDHLDHVVG